MRRVIHGGLMLALVATLAACPPPERDPAEFERAMEELREGYVNAYNQQDAEAVAQYYTTDATFVDADGTELTGRDQLRQQLEQVFAEGLPQLTVSPIETQGDQRLGWQYGTFEIHVQAPAAPQPAQPTPEPGQAPGDRPLAQPTPTPAPGEPPADLQPGQPVTPQPQRIEGRYLIVLERNDDRWRIRAQVNNAGMPGEGMGAPRAPGVTPPGMPPPAEPMFPGQPMPPAEPMPPEGPPTEETVPPEEPPTDEPYPEPPPQEPLEPASED